MVIWPHVSINVVMPFPRHMMLALIHEVFIPAVIIISYFLSRQLVRSHGEASAQSDNSFRGVAAVARAGSAAVAFPELFSTQSCPARTRHAQW